MNHISSIKLKYFLLFNLFIPVTFFIFAIYFMPISQVFQFDTSDEGIELIKALLHQEGFALYTQIWNDQPPLFTIILSFWLSLFGKSIFAARLLTLSFSTILIWSFCQTLRIYLGNLPAIIGTLLLVISCNFLRLSVSVMIGVPALALAMLSIYILTLYKQKFSPSLIVISGALLALSLQIKLFTAFIIPLIIFDLVKLKFTKYKIAEVSDEIKNMSIVRSCALALKRNYELKRLFFDITLWLASLSIVFILVSVLCNSLDNEQLLKSHFHESVKTAFNQEKSLKLTLLFFLQDFDYLLLAIPAIITIFQKREWEKCFPLVWLLIVIILLINHRPVWYHHYLLISIPLIWLATYGATLSFDFFRQRNWLSNIFHLLNKGWWAVPTLRNNNQQDGGAKSELSNFKQNKIKKLTLSGFAAGSLIFSTFVAPIKLGIIQLENHRYIEQGKDNVELVNVMLHYKKTTQWVFTDCPIYAFYSSLRVPPEIAVLSHIRIESKTITREQFISVFETYHPEQVLLCKSKTIRGYINSYLNEHYLKIYENHVGTHYLLKKT